MKKYVVHTENWEKDPEEPMNNFDGYVDGPYDEEDIEVNTKKEAMDEIKKFKKNHPKTSKYGISYDIEDGQDLVIALKANEGDIQYCIEVWKNI